MSEHVDTPAGALVSRRGLLRGAVAAGAASTLARLPHAAAAAEGKAATKGRIKQAIVFTGYRWHDAEDPKSGAIGRGEGADNCVKGLKQLIGHAEKKKVNVCMEHLNTRDSSHPMKGHPGYQGDDLDHMAGIIRRVG